MATWTALLLVLLLVAGVAWALRPVRTAGPSSPSEAWWAAERHARRTSAAAWCTLLPLPLLLAYASAGYVHGPGRGALLAVLPGIAGIAFLLVHAVGEQTWP